MAKKMSAKQIKFFGSKRQRAALKAKRSKPNPARRKKTVARKQKHRARTKARSNPGEIISLTLGNPARKRGKKKAMAKTKRRKKASAPRSNSAGRRRTKKNPGHRRRSQRNPAGYGISEILALGGGAVIGGTVPSLASQAVLGAKNTGAMGYLANLAGTGILAWAAHRFVPRQKFLAAGILAGGVGAVLRRALTDYTFVGGYLNNAGMGDYMASNWVTPQRLPNALDNAMAENGYQAPQIVMASAAAGAGVGGLIGAPLY
jgi:hypothetical protein